MISNILLLLLFSGSGTTYEELKPSIITVAGVRQFSSGATYEELKPWYGGYSYAREGVFRRYL